VDVLGRIFERSITDIEEIKAKSLDEHARSLADRRRKPGRRKEQGVYYTADYIVNYLVGAALDPLWEQKRSDLTAEHGVDPDGTDLPSGRFLRAMLAWLDAVTLCDPACGSGAFLIAAYDWFLSHRLSLLDDLSHVEPGAEACAGGRDDWIERSAPLILQNNLFGVDISPESVEIAQLSLWIRTARPGQLLTDLSAHIRCGNSVVDDPAVDSKAFDWKTQFPHVFERGGFDAVVGNPPYVRQELLSPTKPYFQEHYQAYHGMADLYVYFYERGVQILRPGGRLAFVVTNKWMKAGYAEPLRRFFGEKTWVEQVVDFGHAKQFFKDADVFPSFLVVRKPDDGPVQHDANVCVIPRDMVRIDQLSSQVKSGSLKIELSQLTGDAWSLESSEGRELFKRVRDRGMPLKDVLGKSPLMGIKTGFNKAFLIDTATRQGLTSADPACASVIQPYVRGQDIERWHTVWDGLWMIALKSSGDHAWPWSSERDTESAEGIFRQTYPSLYARLKPMQEALMMRQDKGRFWWELRACA
ncbi:MAG: Eco57I restriction-modification methylase domain-containing protein, partial [Isosphaeraceae bacterium]